MSLATQHSRLPNFDLLRLTLVLLALVSHFKLSQKWDLVLSNETWETLTVISRAAMPGLLIVFGFMIEYVYVHKWQTKGPGVVLKKMLYRTILCYLAFVSLAFIGFVAGHNSLIGFLTSFLLVGSADHADLFKYYALLIPITFFLLWFRFTFGNDARFLLVIIAVLLTESVGLVISELSIPTGNLGGMLFGFGDRVGPSIMHALLLLTFGGLVANCTVISKSVLQVRLLTATIILSAGILIIEVYSIGWDLFELQITRYNGYRAHNNYVYFAYGIVTFCLFWLITRVVALKLSPEVQKKITYYGGSTFTIFFFGNLLILLTPILNSNLIVSFGLLVITLALSLASVNALAWSKKHLALVRAIDELIKVAVNSLYGVGWLIKAYAEKKGRRSTRRRLVSSEEINRDELQAH